MMRIPFALTILCLISAGAEAGGLFHRKERQQDDQVPPPPMYTPNGVRVPAWAAKQIANSPEPLPSKSWGRRPWAFALAHSNSSSSQMARFYQLEGGVGPTPGMSNGPMLGNYGTSTTVIPGVFPSLYRGPALPRYPDWPLIQSLPGY
jgi:hypothetical protein